MPALKPGSFRSRTGPHKGVQSDISLYNSPPDLLTDALNLVFPAATIGCVQRAGFGLMNNGTPVYTSATAFRGQLIYSHPMTDGTRINFHVVGGHVLRYDGGNIFTDVTPVGIAIDATVTTQVFGISLIGELALTDGVNRPWIASNLTATPWTGTYIDYDGIGGSWNTRAAPTLYGNAPFWLLDQVNGVSRWTDESWGEPGFLDTGYQQPDYDNNWTVETASAAPIFAHFGANEQLTYWRALSMGKIAGTVGPDLQSSATEDTATFNVGTQACRSIQQFGTAYFFIDTLGRPWRWQPGAAPEPIWNQMQFFVQQNATGAPSVTAAVSCSVIEPVNNKYWVGIWSPNPAGLASVTELYCFDAATGRYEGRLEVKDAASIDCLGTFVDPSGRVTVIVSGSRVAGGTNGYLWSLNTTTTNPLTRITMSGDTRVTMMGDTRVTMSQAASWQDDGETMNVSASSPYFAYDDDLVANVDMVTVTTTSVSPLSVSVSTASMVDTTQGTPSPSPSADGTSRLVCGANGFGRGPRVTVIPLETDEQWGLQSIAISGTLSTAYWSDA